MTAQEDAGEHAHPEPGPSDDAYERCSTEHQKSRVCCKYPARELEDANGLAERMSSSINGVCPKHS